jgi:NAD(P)-dependent dehydrogenase (short-subunit alcohol dehydrogenase family)
MTEATNPTGVAVVTGGGRGIGRAAALALSAAGWQIVVAGRTEASLVETVELADGPGLAVVADVADEASVDALFDATVERFGRVDLLFNNAGLAAPAMPVDELDPSIWRDLIDVNVTGAFLCARAAFGRMRHQDPQGGRIINNGSISATTPRLYSAPYTASKHAVTGLTKSLALDGRQFNIACGQIDIGNVSSDMTAAMSGGVLQADGSTKSEPTMGMDNVARSVVHMASLPLEANVLTMTVLASGMPFVGRG